MDKTQSTLVLRVGVSVPRDVELVPSLSYWLIDTKNSEVESSQSPRGINYCERFVLRQKDHFDYLRLESAHIYPLTLCVGRAPSKEVHTRHFVKQSSLDVVAVLIVGYDDH